MKWKDARPIGAIQVLYNAMGGWGGPISRKKRYEDVWFSVTRGGVYRISRKKCYVTFE